MQPVKQPNSEVIAKKDSVGCKAAECGPLAQSDRVWHEKLLQITPQWKERCDKSIPRKGARGVPLNVTAPMDLHILLFYL